MIKNKFFQGLSLNVLLLGLVSFLNDISSEMIFAIMPFFITSLGGGGIGLGLIGGLQESISAVLKVFSGYWSDKSSRKKPFIFWGYFISSLAKLFFPFVKSWPVLAVLTPIERVGKGLRTAPRDTLIANSVSGSLRGKAFGLHRALDTFGAFLGALGAFIFLWFLKLEFRVILFIASLFGFLSLVPFFWIKEKEASPLSLTFRLSLKSLHRGFKHYLISTTTFSLGNLTYMFFILKSKLSFQKFFPSQLAITLPILLYIWFNIVYAFSSFPAGALSDRIGKKTALALGYLTYSFSCVGFSLINSSAGFIILFSFYGLSFGLIEVASRAYAASFVAENLRGTALGIFHTLNSLAILVGGIISGILWDFQPDFTFIYGASLGVLASLLLLKVSRE